MPKIRSGRLELNIPHVVVVIRTNLVHLIESPGSSARRQFAIDSSPGSHHRAVITGGEAQQPPPLTTDVVREPCP